MNEAFAVYTPKFQKLISTTSLACHLYNTHYLIIAYVSLGCMIDHNRLAASSIYAKWVYDRPAGPRPEKFLIMCAARARAPSEVCLHVFHRGFSAVSISDACRCVHKEVTPEMIDSLGNINFLFLYTSYLYV